MKEIYEGLGILLKYKPQGADSSCAAEHDIIYASGPPPEELDPEDKKKLEKLHWVWEEGFDSWIKFT